MTVLSDYSYYTLLTSHTSIYPRGYSSIDMVKWILDMIRSSVVTIHVDIWDKRKKNILNEFG